MSAIWACEENQVPSYYLKFELAEQIALTQKPHSVKVIFQPMVILCFFSGQQQQTWPGFDILKVLTKSFPTVFSQCVLLFTHVNWLSSKLSCLQRLPALSSIPTSFSIILFQPLVFLKLIKAIIIAIQTGLKIYR